MGLPDRLLLEALERVWGFEVKPAYPGLVSIPRPWGFVVAERRPGRLSGGEWLVYLVRKEGVPTPRVVGEIVRLTGSVEARVSGLKDSDAISYQYVYVRGGTPVESLEGRGWRAWLVGRRQKPPMLGGHMWNVFRLTLRVLEGEPRDTCRALESLRYAPGLYGPQRFGVRRPDSHLSGLYLSMGAWGRLLAEMSHSYPYGGRPGGYESRSLEESVRAGAPRLLGIPARIMVQAVQSYLWNRAASKALGEGVERFAEAAARTPCPVRGRALVASLPSRRMLENPSSEWGKLVARIAFEEGVPPIVLPARAPRRALAAEPCMLKCSVRGGEVVVWTALPRGLFATSLVRAAVYVDWLSSLGELG